MNGADYQLVKTFEALAAELGCRIEIDHTDILLKHQMFGTFFTSVEGALQFLQGFKQGVNYDRSN